MAKNKQKCDQCSREGRRDEWIFTAWSNRCRDTVHHCCYYGRLSGATKRTLVAKTEDVVAVKIQSACFDMLEGCTVLSLCLMTRATCFFLFSLWTMGRATESHFKNRSLRQLGNGEGEGGKKYVSSKKKDFCFSHHSPEHSIAHLTPQTTASSDVKVCCCMLVRDDDQDKCV